jgi:hypothetical protein
MASPPARDDLSVEELALLARYDGAERIPDLGSSRLVMIAPSASADDPVAVTIEWAQGTIERPLPGSALWRAVLERRLEAQRDGDPGAAAVQHQIRRSLERFPDLETWWHWVRTGWTAPPAPETPRPPRSTGRWRPP